MGAFTNFMSLGYLPKDPVGDSVRLIVGLIVVTIALIAYFEPTLEWVASTKKYSWNAVLLLFGAYFAFNAASGGYRLLSKALGNGYDKID